MGLSKPILMNNTEIEHGLCVNARIDSSDDREVYALSNAKYIYLFKNLRRKDILNSMNRYDVIYIKLSGEEIPGVISSDFSRKEGEKIEHGLTELVGLESVAGMNNLKELLINEVIKPLRSPEDYVKFKLKIPNGILLYGPPGCGKTYIVRKLAEELGYNFIEVKASDVGSSYIHGSVEKISKVFQQAKDSAPSIIFFDEIEGLVPDRDSLGESGSLKQEEINQFLSEMNDSSENNVLVVGATNRPHLIDKAILRSGRMDKRIYVSPPDFEARKELFKLCLIGRPTSEKIDYDGLAKKTENFVSSDIELIVESAARLAVKDSCSEITEALIEKVINSMSPSITESEVDYYVGLQESLERW